ncbi:MAG: hypothetical protein KIC82_01940 [Acholeplasma sp.]|nr:hypothetical protein [Acholeplasma sp.]
MALIKCEECEKEYDVSYKECSHCASPNKKIGNIKNNKNKVIIAIIVVFAVVFVIGIAKTVKAYKELKEMEKNNYEMQVDNYNKAKEVRGLIQETLEK